MDNISAKMAALRGKVSELERAAAQRKAKLDENSAFLQFNWKADVVESWIGTDLQNQNLLWCWVGLGVARTRTLVLESSWYTAVYRTGF